MTTHAHQPDPTELQLVENIVTTLHRAGMKERRLAVAVGINHVTLNRRMRGVQPWMFWEVQAIADYFGLSLAEITTALPSREEWEGRWYAIRDSNPEPADMSSRHLRLVPPLGSASVRHLRVAS